MSKKQLLIKTHDTFSSWVRHNRILESNATRLSGQLRSFLEKWVLVDSQHVEAFLRTIPKALGQCDNSQALVDPMFPAAYAYLHLIERYRRTWHALELLYKVGALPFGHNPLHIADVGMGPGPNSYAVGDFYKTLNEFAAATGHAELITNNLSPFIIERSGEMCHFTHLFSEHAQYPGPFGANRSEFCGFFPSEESSRRWRHLVDEVSDDLDTSEEFAAWWLRDSGYRRGEDLDFRIVVMSYFFTPDNLPALYRKEVADLFGWLRPGAVVLQLGGGGAQYSSVWQQIETMADQAGLRTLTSVPGSVSISYNDETAHTIKQFYLKVWQLLEAQTSIDADVVEGVPEDIREASVPLTGPRSFAIRVFRK